MSIAIVGGGIAGCAAALYLAELGHSVTVVERGVIAGEASGVNAGALGGLGWGPLPTLDDTLTTGGMALFQQMQFDRGEDIELRRSGNLEAIQTEAELDEARERFAVLRDQGYQLELLSAREASALEPALNHRLLGALYSPLRGQADPIKTTRAFARAATRAGARILTDWPVKEIQWSSAGGYRLQSGRAEGDKLDADRLVIAAGAWSRQLGHMLGLELPVVPVRGQMWATAPQPPTLFTVIAAAESAHHWRRAEQPGDDPPQLTHRAGRRMTRHLYGRQRRSGEIIFGGDREAVGFHKETEPVGIRVNREQAAEVAPLLARLPVDRTWAGLMPFTLDGQPLIGAISHRPGLYIVGGLASSGFGRGPMAAKLLADTIHTGAIQPLLRPADPDRCVTERDA